MGFGSINRLQKLCQKSNIRSYLSIFLLSSSPVLDLSDSDDSTKGPALPTDESKIYLLLVDLAIRSSADVSVPLPSIFTRLATKMQAAGEDLTREKFFHSHDVGESGLCLAGIARVPRHMYQKLELARHIVSKFGIEKPLEVLKMH